MYISSFAGFRFELKNDALDKIILGCRKIDLKYVKDDHQPVEDQKSVKCPDKYAIYGIEASRNPGEKVKLHCWLLGPGESNNGESNNGGSNNGRSNNGRSNNDGSNKGWSKKG